MKFATAVPTKGSSGKFAVDKALEFLAEVGDMDGQVIIKNDQEPSIQYFINDMVESRVSGRTHLEESPVKSSGSNGVVVDHSCRYKISEVQLGHWVCRA